MFELIKRHHVDTFDSDTTYDTGQKKVEEYEATDIHAHKGIQFKPHAPNAGDLYNATKPKPNEIASSTTYQSNSLLNHQKPYLKDVRSNSTGST